MTRARYRLSGLRLSIQTDRPAVLRDWQDWLALEEDRDPEERASIRCSFLAGASGNRLCLPPDAQPVEAYGGMQFYRQGRQVFLARDKEVLACVDPRSGCVQGRVSTDAPGDSWLQQQAVFLPVLSVALRAQGYFPVHASALEHDGLGVLFPSLTGGGKSTLCLNLVRSGFRFLSDDMPLLRADESEIAVHSLSDKLSLREDTLAFFPELASLHGRASAESGKITFAPDSIYPGRWASRAVPRLLAFPILTGEESSRVRPITPAEALARLLPNSLSLLDPGAVESQFRVLGDLVEQCRCWELAAGRDVETHPSLIRDLMEESRDPLPAPLPVHGMPGPPEPAASSRRHVGRSPAVLWRVLDGEAVLLHPPSGHYCSLNRMGASIWELADGSLSPEAIAQRITRDYDVELPQALADVSTLLRDLQQEGMAA